jgi:hypothetical protein
MEFNWKLEWIEMMDGLGLDIADADGVSLIGSIDVNAL